MFPHRFGQKHAHYTRQKVGAVITPWGDRPYIAPSPSHQNTSFLLLSLFGGRTVGETLDKEGIWRFATDYKMFYFLHPENAIIESIIFRLFEGKLKITEYFSEKCIFLSIMNSRGPPLLIISISHEQCGVITFCLR